MKAQDIIKDKLGGFLDYLKQISEIDPNRFRTDQLMQLVLLQEYLKYNDMMKQFYAKQKRNEAVSSIENIDFVSVLNRGEERFFKAKLNRLTGAVEIVDNYDVDRSLVELEYVVVDGNRIPCSKRNGDWACDLADLENIA